MATNNIFKVEINDNVAKNPETKVPSKVLHFSDGTVECYDDENEEESQEPTENKTVIDPSTLKWGPWLAHKAIHTGQTFLNACDYAGETLAYYLGITTPKYQFEIEMYQRMQRLEKEEAEQSKGWVSNQDSDVKTQQPQPPDAVV